LAAELVTVSKEKFPCFAAGFRRLFYRSVENIAL
jgi:hypothetical protein